MGTSVATPTYACVYAVDTILVVIIDIDLLCSGVVGLRVNVDNGETGPRLGDGV